MLVKVGLLCEDGGRPLPKHREIMHRATFVGYLRYGEEFDKEFRRHVYKATLRDPSSLDYVLPTLYDATLRFIADGALTISGIEVDEISRRRTAQSWYIELASS